MDSKALQYSFGFTHPSVVLDPFWGRAFWSFWDLEAWSTINHQRSGRYTPRKTPTAQLFKGHKEGKNHPISNVVRLLLLSVLWADLSMKKIEKGYPPSKRRPYYKGRCHCLTVARSIKYNRGWYTKNLFHTEIHQFLQMKLDLKQNTYPYNPSRDVASDFHPKQHQPKTSPCLTQFEDSTLRAVQPEQKLGGKTTSKLIQISRNDAE